MPPNKCKAERSTDVNVPEARGTNRSNDLEKIAGKAPAGVITEPRGRNRS